MFTDKFMEVLTHEGVVSLVTWNEKEANVTNTWNSYLVLTDDNRILIPAAGLKSTEADIAKDNRIKVTLGAKEVEGFNGYEGTGFKIEGTAEFLTEGEDFELMFERYPFIRSTLAVTVDELKQLL